jgi:hypothetical protein
MTQFARNDYFVPAIAPDPYIIPPMRPLPVSVLRQAAGVVLLLLASGPALAIPIPKNSSGAALEAPKGFEEVVNGTNADPQEVRTMVRRDEQGEIGIDIETLPSPGEPPDSPSRRPPTWQQILSNNLNVVRIYSERWNDADLEVLCAQSLTNGTNFLMHIVDIPLRPDPIRVSVKSQARRESEARAILKSMLTQLDESGNPRSTADAHAMAFKASLYVVLVLVVVFFMARGRS